MKPSFDEYFESLRGKRVLVLGLGVSNRPLVRLLLRYGCDVTGCDKMESPDEELREMEARGLKLKLGNDYLEGLSGDVVFRTPGLLPTNPALRALKESGAEITSEMELFFELCPCTVIAVTGSDGKTTTTTLISEMLKAAGYSVWLGGNIGQPLLSFVPQIQRGDYAVVELSSFQLMDMRRSPHIAVITNLEPNHLDMHRDMDEYVEAKKNVFSHQTGSDVLVLNADNPITSGFSGNGRTRWFSRLGKTESGICMEGDRLVRDGTAIMNKQDIRIPGEHNVENYMAAILAVEGLVDDETILTVARTFGGVEHRIELVRMKNGVRYYNDSIASSPTRTIAGLKSFPEKVLLIAGGYDKHIPYDALGVEICRHTKRVYLNGATAPLIRRAVETAPEYTPGKPEMIDCGDFTTAVRRAAADARPGDVILMSPASAAFDQFKNFMERGKYFKKLVGEL